MQAAAAIAKGLTAGLKPGEILRIVRAQVRPIVGGDCWALARLDRGKRSWDLTAVEGQSDGNPGPRGRLPLDHPLLAPILEFPGAPFFGCRSPRPESGDRDLPFGVEIGSYILLPLMTRDRLAGALVLGNSTGATLDRSDRDFLGLVADQAALALENAYLCEQVELERQLKRLTVTDDLTGLYNQRDLFEQLPREMERANRAGSACSLCLFDLDRFKDYNDSHGHLAGDRLLRSVGAVVSRTIRAKIDRAFRYGGDEFVLLLPNTNRAEAQVLVDRLRRAISQALAGPVTFSAGIAEYSPGMESKDFIEAADRLMYRAKRKGGGRMEPGTAGAETGRR
jgi:diguanylate cyclase (GGDEF)-like protein